MKISMCHIDDAVELSKTNRAWWAKIINLAGPHGVSIKKGLNLRGYIKNNQICHQDEPRK